MAEGGDNLPIAQDTDGDSHPTCNNTPGNESAVG
jgi:hypothetical protein